MKCCWVGFGHTQSTLKLPTKYTDLHGFLASKLSHQICIAGAFSNQVIFQLLQFLILACIWWSWKREYETGMRSKWGREQERKASKYETKQTGLEWGRRGRPAGRARTRVGSGGVGWVWAKYTRKCHHSETHSFNEFLVNWGLRKVGSAEATFHEHLLWADTVLNAVF
jgi:hypothetical protein